MFEENKGSRLPAGSTLEIAPGVHIAHPHAEVNLPGKPDNRVLASEAVTESTVKVAAQGGGGGIVPLGEAKSLSVDVVPGTLTTLDDSTVIHVKQGHDAEQLLVDQVAATGKPVEVGDTKIEPAETPE